MLSKHDLRSCSTKYNIINALQLEKVVFQALSLRHLYIANPKTGPSRGLFLYVPKGFARTIRPSETGRLREIGLRTPTVSFHPPLALGETDSPSPYISMN